MSTARSCQQCGRLLRSEDRFCPHCGTGQREPEQTAVPIGEGSAWDAILEKLALATAPRYRILRLLGYGGMAGVYLADEPRLGRQVAIKVMSPALLIDGAMVTRFQQEARTTAHLSHPNIVTIFDVDSAEGLQYFVMAYVPGRTLANIMSGRSEPLPIDATLHWLAQIGAGLHHAHQTNIVHRDIKPGNILFDGRGNALVTDFGIAKVADEPSLTRTGLLVGTPSYMSPEQCLAEQVTGASDQYSLGVLAYEMLAGRPPFSGQTVRVLSAHVNDTPPPLSRLRPDCPPKVAEAVAKMLAKKPADRYPNIAAALAAMGARPLDYHDARLEEIAPLTARVARLEVQPPPSLAVGERATLEARTLDARGHVLEGRAVVVKSEDPGLVAITETGELQGRTPGEARLTVTCEGVAVRVPVLIAPGAGWTTERALEIVAPRETIIAGESVSLLARLPGQSGEETGPVAWESSNPSIARVSPDGQLTGLHPGVVTVTASVQGRTATTLLTIAPTTAERTAPSFGGLVEDDEETRVHGTPPPIVASSSEPWESTTGGALYTSPETPAPSGGPAPRTPPPNAPPAVTPPPSTPPPAPPPDGYTTPAPPATGPATRQPTPIPAPAPPREVAGGAAEPARRRIPVAAAVLGGLVLVTAVAALVLGDRGGAPSPEPAGAPIPVEPDGGIGSGAPPPAPPLPADTLASPVVVAPPSADTAGARAQAGADARQGAAAAAPPQTQRATPPRAAPPPAPAEGRVVLGIALPAGGTATLRGPGGRTVQLSRDPVALPPGRYTVQLRAAGYVPIDTEIEVTAGETQRWTPVLAEVPAAPPPPPPARPEPPPVDAAAERADAEQAVRTRLNELAAAFESRQMNRVVVLYPSAPQDWRTRWAAMVENTQAVRELKASVGQVGDVEVDGDIARVRFTLRIDYRDFRNAQQQTSTPFAATLRRSGGSWVITELR